MTGRVSSSGSRRWSRSVANPTHERHEPRPEDDERERVAGESPGQEREGTDPDEHAGERPPVDDPTRRVLLVVLRPARREPVGDAAEDATGRREGEAQGIHGRPIPGDRCGAAERAQSAFAPASASSTSVACEAPVAPRGAYEVALR